MTPTEHSAIAEAIAAREVADRLERAHKNWCACDGMDHNQTKMVGYDIVKLIEDNVDVILASLRAVAPAPADDTFQSRVKPWMDACFGPVISADKIERNHRFLEEALELVQACGCSRDEAHQLVDYVYGRNQGDINQEVGGVMVTLAALCLANGFDMHSAAETELARVWTKVEQIRAKQAAKPKHSPLPAAPADQSDAGRDGVIEQVIAVLKTGSIKWTASQNEGSMVIIEFDGRGNMNARKVAEALRNLCQTRAARTPTDGKPFYCVTCGSGWNECGACEEVDCRMESIKDAEARALASAPSEAPKPPERQPQ